jgi:hypothetical protein
VSGECHVDHEGYGSLFGAAKVTSNTTGFIAYQETGYCLDFLDFDMFTEFTASENGGWP